MRVGLGMSARCAVRQRRQRARTGRLQQFDEFVGDLGQLPLVGIGQPMMQFAYRHPGNLGDFNVFVAEFTSGEPEQIVVDGLVNAKALGDKPVVDAAERC